MIFDIPFLVKKYYLRAKRFYFDLRRPECTCELPRPMLEPLKMSKEAQEAAAVLDMPCPHNWRKYHDEQDELERLMCNCPIECKKKKGTR